MVKFGLTLGIGLMGLLVSSVSLAAPGPPQHRYGHGYHHGYHHGYYQGGGIPNYDAAAEITVSGIVDRIWTEDCLGCGCDGGTHVTLEAEGATYEAHLGPTCYLVGKGWELLSGERIEVTGVLLPHRGEGKALVVREMKRGNETLLLRDKTGVPLWSRPPCE
jgi:hypothetical protein